MHESKKFNALHIIQKKQQKEKLKKAAMMCSTIRK